MVIALIVGVVAAGQVSAAGVQVANAALMPIAVTLTYGAGQIATSETQLNGVDSLRLSGRGETLLAQSDGSDETATLLGIRALRVAQHQQGRDLLQSSVDRPCYGQAALTGHTDSVFGALALADGRFLSWSGDKTLRLWYLDTSQCIVYACSRVFR
ncbi:MAG: hypothetical protein SGJ24_14680 [Chloroflexota bacterium]|nr:hypothetical protein [Chloroflexota bacterium]